MPGLVLAIDGGGSNTRVVLGGEGGGVLREARGGPGSALYVNHQTYPRELARLVNGVIVHEEPPVRVGCAGPMNRSLVTQVVAGILPGVPVRWYSEGEIALGVYDLAWGVTVVAGTGSSSRAATPAGEWIETGGFGPQFDDLGSGYWIAREAIAAVLRAEHGRAPETSLRGAMLHHFGIEKCWDLIPLCEANGHINVTRVAGFTHRVAQEAARGDAVAREVCLRAAEHLADLVVASARRAGLDALPHVPVVPTGGVFRAREVVYTPFREAVIGSGLSFDVLEPVPDPVIGLLNLLARG